MSTARYGKYINITEHENKVVFALKEEGVKLVDIFRAGLEKCLEVYPEILKRKEFKDV